jgi:hypothetical protein
VSYSGAGLYDDDAGADARGRYRELVADGTAGEDATNALLAEWADALDDHDVACAFWLALADTQWRVGRLEDRVRDRALTIIDSGDDLARFGHDRRLAGRRRIVLDRLREEITSPQRAPARIRAPFRSVSPVAVGDVFWVNVTGGRVLLRCVAITGDERDSYPTVEVLDWLGPDAPPDPAVLEARSGGSNASGRWPDLLCLVRYAHDPDPSERIEIIATGGGVMRRRTEPASMVAWVHLEDALPRFFGD